MFRRLRQAIGRIFTGRQAPPIPDQQTIFGGRQPQRPSRIDAPLPPESITGGYEPPPISEPPPTAPEGLSTDLISVYGDRGEYIGTQTYEQWVDDMLLSTDELIAKYGLTYYTYSPFGRATFIEIVLENAHLHWDAEQWDAWREQYENING